MSIQPNENHPPSERKTEPVDEHEEESGWDHEKPLLEHFEDFRTTFLKCLASLVFACIGVGVFFVYFANALNAPLEWALEGNEEIQVAKGLVTSTPMGVFTVMIQICFLGGLAMSLPFMLYHIARFIAPALTPAERKILVPSCIAACFLFLVGVAFSYFFVLPTSLKVIIELNKVMGYHMIWSAQNYYGLVVWMTLGIGFCFEFPILLVILQYLGIVPTEQLRSARRYMAVIILIIGALIVPGGDPISLMIMVVPLYVLYELSMIIGGRMSKRRLNDMSTEDVL